MKKIIVFNFIMVFMLVTAGMVVAGERQWQKQDKEFAFPKNAIEISPGVFYLGESMNKGKVVEGYAFVHYAKGYEPIKKVKPSEESSCYSFIKKDMEWKTQPSYIINPTNNDGLSDDFVIMVVNKATAEWDSYFDIFGDYSTNTSVGFTGDGLNTVSFGNYPSDGVIGVCSVWGVFRGRPSNREITEFDVMFDTDFTWGDGEVNSSLMDLQNIATHELGHAIGLGDLYDSECDAQTMYGYSTEGDIEKRTLESGDIAGLTILYGG